MLSGKEIQEFRRKLLAWFRKNKRNLPWRKTKDPYRIWISEIMLQQTTVPAVIPYYKRWLKVFPNINAIAASSPQKILKTWQGLGYYQRVRNIQKTARIIKKSFHGKIPTTYEELIKLPGIGPYTAGAMLSFLYNKRYPSLEANTRRVLSRILCLEESSDAKTEKRLSSFQTQLLPFRSVGYFNQSLMELGSLVCLIKNPFCLKCPIKSFCLAYKQGKQELIPFKVQRKKVRKIEAVIGIIKQDNKILIQKRPSKGPLADLWEFPGGKQKSGESRENALRRELKEELGIEIDKATFLQKVNHAYTHFRVALFSYQCKVSQSHSLNNLPDRCHWVSKGTIRKYPFPSGSSRIVDFLLHHWHALSD